jgi:exodeoxyribonuclease-3
MVVVFLYDGRLRFARRSMTRDTSGRNRLFRVISLNANGIRAAARKGFFDWMAKQDADVVCIQETKAQVHQLGDEIFSPSGYHCYYEDAVKKGYSGVAIYSKHKPKKVIRGYGDKEFDDEGRYLEVQLDGISVVSLYLPSGSSKEERQIAKYRCMESFTEHLHKLRRKRNEYVICGDWNIVHKEADIKNWKANQKNSGCLPEERAWLDKVFGEYGYADAFRIAARPMPRTLAGASTITSSPGVSKTRSAEPKFIKTSDFPIMRR